MHCQLDLALGKFSLCLCGAATSLLGGIAGVEVRAGGPGQWRLGQSTWGSVGRAGLAAHPFLLRRLNFPRFSGRLSVRCSSLRSDVLLLGCGATLLVEDIPCHGTVIRLVLPGLSGARQGLRGELYRRVKV